MDGTSVRLVADAAHLSSLQGLVTAFPSSRISTPGTLEVDLDDLLRNLRALGSWPSTDVSWQGNLRRLVEDSVRDARAAQRFLAGDSLPDRTTQSARDALGTDWIANLTEFQLRDLVKLLSLRHGANFSVPGAGKTRVGLAAFAAARNEDGIRRLLVVAPKSAFESWLGEIRGALPNDSGFGVVDGDDIPLSDKVLINYERLPRAQGQLASWLAAEPAMMILDEAHRMKLGQEGAYGAACLAIGPQARRRLILTGTPAPNGVNDLRSLMSFVWPGQGRQVVNQAVGGGNLQQASVALRPFFTRTTKTELDLPPVTTSLRYVDLPPLHREIYAGLRGQFSQRLLTSSNDLEALGRITMYLLMAADSPALLATGTTRYEPLAYRVPPIDVPVDAPLHLLLRDLPGQELSPKYREVLAMVSDNARRGRKTLVWSTFVRSLTTLRSMLGVFAPALVHGGTEDRDAEIRRFRDDPDCMVMLSNPATLGEGISLHQVCNDAIFVDRDFAAGRYLQSLDRIHRLGLPPDTETNVTVLIARNTIDEVVDLRLTQKLRFMSAVLDDPDVEVLADLQEEPTTGASLTSEDLQGLLGHLHETAS